MNLMNMKKAVDINSIPEFKLDTPQNINESLTMYTNIIDDIINEETGEAMVGTKKGFFDTIVGVIKAILGKFEDFRKTSIANLKTFEEQLEPKLTAMDPAKLTKFTYTMKPFNEHNYNSIQDNGARAIEKMSSTLNSKMVESNKALQEEISSLKNKLATLRNQSHEASNSNMAMMRSKQELTKEGGYGKDIDLDKFKDEMIANLYKETLSTCKPDTFKADAEEAVRGDKEVEINNMTVKSIKDYIKILHSMDSKIKSIQTYYADIIQKCNDISKQHTDNLNQIKTLTDEISKVGAGKLTSDVSFTKEMLKEIEATNNKYMVIYKEAIRHINIITNVKVELHDTASRDIMNLLFAVSKLK